MTTAEREAKDMPEQAESDGEGRVAAVREAAENMAESVGGTARDVASELASRLPEAAATTKGAIGEASRRMDASSSEMLAVGTSLWVGLAIGLLIGGANRILVAIAMIPAAAMGMTLLDRQSRTGPNTTRPAR